MLTHGSTPPTPAAAELGLARDRLGRAAAEVEELRARARALAAATDWRSRAAEGFRSRMTELIGLIDRLADRIALADSECAREVSRVLGAAGARGG